MSSNMPVQDFASFPVAVCLHSAAATALAPEIRPEPPSPSMAGVFSQPTTQAAGGFSLPKTLVLPS